MQFYGGDGMAFLEERDPLKAALAAAVASAVADHEDDQLKMLARYIRNEIADMLG